MGGADTVKGPPTEVERKKCWAARDALWQCYDEYKENESKCTKQRKAYENSCSKQWVKHFDRKYKYEKFKAEYQKEGATSPEGLRRKAEVEANLK